MWGYDKTIVLIPSLAVCLWDQHGHCSLAETFVLVLAGVQLISFIAACTVLSFELGKKAALTDTF